MTTYTENETLTLSIETPPASMTFHSQGHAFRVDTGTGVLFADCALPTTTLRQATSDVLAHVRQHRRLLPASQRQIWLSLGLRILKANRHYYRKGARR